MLSVHVQRMSNMCVLKLHCNATHVIALFPSVAFQIPIVLNRRRCIKRFLHVQYEALLMRHSHG